MAILQVLKVFPYPVTLSALQFLCGTILVGIMWTFNLYKRPKIRSDKVYSDWFVVSDMCYVNGLYG